MLQSQLMFCQRSVFTTTSHEAHIFEAARKSVHAGMRLAQRVEV